MIEIENQGNVMRRKNWKNGKNNLPSPSSPDPNQAQDEKFNRKVHRSASFGTNQSHINGFSKVMSNLSMPLTLYCSIA